MAPIIPKQSLHELFDLCDRLMKNTPGIKQFTTQGRTPVHVMFYSGDGAPYTVIELMRLNKMWDTFILRKDDFRCIAAVRLSYSPEDRARQLTEITETPPYSPELTCALNTAYFKLINSTRRAPYSLEPVPFFTETEADAELGAVMRGLSLVADRAQLAVQKGPGIHEI